MAAHTSMAPSPIANLGAFSPRIVRLSRTSRQLWVDSRTPSSMARNRLLPRAVSPTITRAQSCRPRRVGHCGRRQPRCRRWARHPEQRLSSSRITWPNRDFSRKIVFADNPAASGPRRALRAGAISPRETPLRQSHGKAASNDLGLRT